MIAFAATTGAAVCAEGVEDLDDLRALAALDVTYAQGYALARPAPPWPLLAPGAAARVGRPARDGRPRRRRPAAPRARVAAASPSWPTSLGAIDEVADLAPAGRTRRRPARRRRRRADARDRRPAAIVELLSAHPDNRRASRGRSTTSRPPRTCRDHRVGQVVAGDDARRPRRARRARAPGHRRDADRPGRLGVAAAPSWRSTACARRRSRARRSTAPAWWRSSWEPYLRSTT